MFASWIAEESSLRTANYFVLGEIYGLLERIELIDGIPFERFDPDDSSDVAAIVERFIRPAFVAATKPKQDLIRWSLEYYCSTGIAPLQLLKDRCQELSLPDCASPIEFFRRVGETLFLGEFSRDIDPQQYEEVLDEDAANLVFAPV
jgi:hypothetical protein